MLGANAVLMGLARIAREWIALAIVWHVLTAALIAALLSGWRPTVRSARGLLAVPLASVGAVAALDGNPFNATIFTALAIAVAAIGAARVPGAVSRGAGWSSVLGGAMIALGAFYPHFLEDRSPLAYLYAAPMGLLPCPTLSVVIGFTLLGGGLGSRAMSLVLACAGLFYGLFGFLVLHVNLDLVLAAGAVGLVEIGVRMIQARRSELHAHGPL